MRQLLLLFLLIAGTLNAQTYGTIILPQNNSRIYTYYGWDNPIEPNRNLARLPLNPGSLGATIIIHNIPPINYGNNIHQFLDIPRYINPTGYDLQLPTKPVENILVLPPCEEPRLTNRYYERTRQK